MFRANIISAHSAAIGVGAITCLLIAHPGAASELNEARDCVIVPHRIVDVSSAVPGLLESVSIERSDLVVSGQVLARLESATERASVDLADAWASIRSEIQLESISQGLDSRRKARVERLYISKAVALDEKDQAATDASLAEVRLRQAREKRWIRELDAKKAEALLERRTVRSPIDGVIVERFRSGGEYIDNQPIARIAQLDPLQVETILPMRQFGDVRPGMQATVIAEHDPDSTFTATVSVVDRVGDAASGTFGVRLSLPNPEHKIPAGLKCTLNLLPAPVVARSPLPRPLPPQQQPLAAMMDSVSTSHQPGNIYGRSLVKVQPTEGAPVAASLQVSPARATSELPNADIAAAARLPVAQISTADVERSCLAIGPIADAQTARRLQNRLGSATRLREDKTPDNAGYIVVSTPIAGDSAQHVERMRAAGVHDLQLLRGGDFHGLVSLGVYVYSSAAERRRDAIAALGFDSEVRSRNTPRWWVTLGPTPHPQTSAHTRAMLESLPQSTDAALVPCSEFNPLSAEKYPGGDAKPRV